MSSDTSCSGTPSRSAAGGGGPTSESPPRRSGPQRYGRRRSTLRSGKTRHVAGMSSLHVLDAVRARTRKGPIHRRGSSERDGRGVCSVCSSTSSPTANCTSRREASSSALCRSCRVCKSDRTSAVTRPSGAQQPCRINWVGCCSRQWPEVYDLCHTFLHVARVTLCRSGRGGQGAAGVLAAVGVEGHVAGPEGRS